MSKLIGALILWMLCWTGVYGFHWLLGDVVVPSAKSATGLWLLVVLWWAMTAITSRKEK